MVELLKLSQSASPTDVMNEEIKKAKVPAIDLLGLKNHLLFFPSRLPTMSAAYEFKEIVSEKV